MTDVMIDISIDVDSELDEPEVAHIVRKDDQIRGYITGQPIEALCGKIWVPTRDPENYPLCQRCVDILKQINAGRQGAN